MYGVFYRLPNHDTDWTLFRVFEDREKAQEYITHGRPHLVYIIGIM
jgi:hypothetical protein